MSNNPSMGVISKLYIQEKVMLESVRFEKLAFKIYSAVIILQFIVSLYFFLHNYTMSSSFNHYYISYKIYLILVTMYFFIVFSTTKNLFFFTLTRFISVTIEISTVTVTIYIFAMALDPATVLVGPLIMIYFLVLTITGFRQSLSLSIYATVLSVLQFLFIHNYLIQFVPKDLKDILIDLGPYGVFQKSLYISLGGIASSFLAYHTKVIISRIAGGSLE